MEKIYGWSEQGGTSVVISGTQGSGPQRFQQSFRSATITIYDAGTLNLSTIYSDNASPPTAKANPFTASSTTGYWEFYVAIGQYDIKFSGGSILSPFTISSVSASSIYPIINAAEMTGATAGAKIVNALAALPSTGGVIDARGIVGAQSITSTISVSKPARILLGATTFTCTSDPVFRIISDSASIVGIGPQSYLNKTSGTGDAIELGDGATSTRDALIKDIKIAATDAMAWGIDLQLAYNAKIENVVLSCSSTASGAIRVDNSIDVEITHVNIGAIKGTGILQQNDSNGLTILGGRIDGFANTAGTGIQLSNRKSTIVGTIVETLLNGIDLGGFGIFISAYFEDCEFGIIDSNPADGVTITGCEFQSSGIATWAINLNQTSNAIISGNNFQDTNTGGAPINIDPSGGAQNIVIGPNLFDDSVEVVLGAKFADANIDLFSEHQHFRPVNYLANTFATWPGGNAATPMLWSNGSGTKARRSDAPFGRYSMDFVGVGDISRRAVPTISATVNANMRGRWVVFSIWVKSISGATSGVLRLTMADGVVTRDNDYTITTSWVRYSVGLQLNSSATLISLAVNNLGAGTFAVAAPSMYLGTTTPKSGAEDELDGSWPMVNTVSTTHTGTVATTTIHSVTIPGRTLGDHGGYRIRGGGSITGTNGQKDIALFLGATGLTSIVEAAGETSDWAFDVAFYNLNATNQVVNQLSFQGAAIEQQTMSTAAENTDADFTIALKVALANAADAIIVKFFSIEPINGK